MLWSASSPAIEPILLGVKIVARYFILFRLKLHWKIRPWWRRMYFSCSCVVCALQEDIKTLSTHVVENFQKELEGVKYVKTFETLKLRYDQQQDRLKDRMNMEGYVWLVMRERSKGFCRLTLSTDLFTATTNCSLKSKSLCYWVGFLILTGWGLRGWANTSIGHRKGWDSGCFLSQW